MSQQTGPETYTASETGYNVHDNDVSSHRTRTNQRPEPAPVHTPEALKQAVNDVYEALEDRG